MGLLIADDVHQRGLATIIPEGAECFSACSFIFLAGAERLAEGSLGVHQISSGLPDLERAQMSISDIIDLLNRFGTPVEVLTIMFRTPANDMHIFTSEEVAAYRLNRSAVEEETATAEAELPLSDGGMAVTSDEIEQALDDATVPERPSASASSMAAISALETYARRPTRVALYEGLDFFGEDLASQRHVSASQCAAACLETSSCKALSTRTPFVDPIAS